MQAHSAAARCRRRQTTRVVPCHHAALQPTAKVALRCSVALAFLHNRQRRSPFAVLHPTTEVTLRCCTRLVLPLTTKVALRCSVALASLHNRQQRSTFAVLHSTTEATLRCCTRLPLLWNWPCHNYGGSLPSDHTTCLTERGVIWGTTTLEA